MPLPSLTSRVLPALVVALLAVFVVAVGSASANGNASGGPVAAVATKKKPKKPKPRPKPAPPKGPFVASDAGQTGIGAGPDDTVVQTLSVPAGKYVVTAKVELGNNAASPNSVSCKLLELFNPIDTGTEDLTPLATFSRTMTLTAASTGGSIKLACTGDKPAQARNRVITAIRG